VLTVVKPVVTLRVTGELDLDNQQQFEWDVVERLRSASVVVDCSALEFLSISALRSLDRCATQAEATHHTFVLTSPSPQVRRLLALAEMEHLLQCPPTD
jgi:anti-anti-sigma factor